MIIQQSLQNNMEFMSCSLCLAYFLRHSWRYIYTVVLCISKYRFECNTISIGNRFSIHIRSFHRLIWENVTSPKPYVNYNRWGQVFPIFTASAQCTAFEIRELTNFRRKNELYAVAEAIRWKMCITISAPKRKYVTRIATKSVIDWRGFGKFSIILFHNLIKKIVNKKLISLNKSRHPIKISIERDSDTLEVARKRRCRKTVKPNNSTLTDLDANSTENGPVRFTMLPLLCECTMFDTSYSHANGPSN